MILPITQIDPSKADVSTPNRAYRMMQPVWDMINSLMGGTQAMRDEAQKYLPMEAAESQQGYNHRLNKTFLFNGMSRSVRTLVGKPFSEDITISEAIKDEFREYLTDADLLGNDLHNVTRQCFAVGVKKGIVHLLMEYPSVKNRITLQDKTAQNIRPYFVVLEPDNVIGWQYVMENGRPVLTQLRILEHVVVQVGTWGEECRERVRVFERIVVDGVRVVGFRLFEAVKNDRGEKMWVIVDEGEITLPEIPLVTMYFGERIGYMLAKPPLEDLAWLNIEHWQSSSDQRNILHVARVPIWFLKGWQPTLDENGAPKDKIIIGPDRMVRLSSPDADMKIIEHTGAAIEAGRKDLQDIEARMAVAGAELLQRRGKTETTATEESHSNKAEDSDLGAMVKATEDGITAALGFMYAWEGQEAPKGKLITISTDFGLTAQDAADLQSLLESRLKGQISHLTYLAELKRRGVLAPHTDINKELSAAKAEGPFIDPNKPAPGPDGQPTIQNKSGAGA
jgi:hypothetical protein